MRPSSRVFPRATCGRTRDSYLGLLNQFFDSAAGAVLAAGGEVLKFIGDAVLAIFPIEACPIKTAGACERALATARDVEAKIAAINRDRNAMGETPLGYGLALQLGEVTYGNVGATDRLDFTVVGPAANETARIAALCKTLKRSLLLSGSFASHVPDGLQSLGRASLARGFRPPGNLHLAESGSGGSKLAPSVGIFRGRRSIRRLGNV